MSLDQVKQMAPLWIEAWNKHNLDELMSMYSENCTFTSPIIKFLNLNDSGKISGVDSVRALMAKCFEDFAELKFELVDVLVGVDNYIVSYKSLEGLPASSVISLNDEGKINNSTVYVSTRYMNN